MTSTEIHAIHTSTATRATTLTCWYDVTALLCAGMDRAELLQRFDGVWHNNIGNSPAEFERQQAEAERRVAPKTYPRKPRGTKY